MSGKIYLGDEVHELAAELQTTRTELELVKMLCERKDEENKMLRTQLAELRVQYEEKATEAVQVGTLLEQQATMLTMGLQRYRRQNTGRVAAQEERIAAQTGVEREEPAPAPAVAPVRATRQQPLAEAVRRAPEPVRQVREIAAEEPEEPPPAFLSRPGQVNRSIDHRLLPALDYRTDDDVLRDMHDTLDSRRKA